MSGVTEIEYVVLTPDDLADLFDFLVKHFYPRENITIGAGLNPVDLTGGLESELIRRDLASGLSIGAREKTTKRLVAVLTCSILTSPPELTEATYGSDPMEKLFRILGMCWSMVDVFQDPGVERVLYIERACVHPDYGRRGIFKEILQKCMDLGTMQGCQLAHVEISSLFSEKAITKLGFETRATLDFHTLEDGMLDLSIMEYKVIKVMTKCLPVPV